MAEHYANEAMIEQIQCSDQWSYYQAKGIKATGWSTKIDLRRAREGVVRRTPPTGKYRGNRKTFRRRRGPVGGIEVKHLARHNALAPAVTMFQLAIAVGAIAVLTRRKVSGGSRSLSGWSASAFSRRHYYRPCGRRLTTIDLLFWHITEEGRPRHGGRLTRDGPGKFRLNWSDVCPQAVKREGRMNATDFSRKWCRRGHNGTIGHVGLLVWLRSDHILDGLRMESDAGSRETCGRH